LTSSTLLLHFPLQAQLALHGCFSCFTHLHRLHDVSPAAHVHRLFGLVDVFD
jgi:hypothetical protein